MFHIKTLVKHLITFISILPVQSNSFVDVDSIIRPANLNSAKSVTSNNLCSKQLNQLDCLDKFKQQKQHDGARFETNVIKQRRSRGRNGKLEDEDAIIVAIKDDKIRTSNPATARALASGKQVANLDQSDQRAAPSTSSDKLERRLGPILVPLVLALLNAILQLLRLVLQLLRQLLRFIFLPLNVLLQVVRLLLRLLDPLFYIQLILFAFNIASNIARAILRLIFIRRRRRKVDKEEDCETRVITLELLNREDNHRYVCPQPKRKMTNKKGQKEGYKSRPNEYLDRRESSENHIRVFDRRTIHEQLLFSELKYIARYLSELDILPSPVASDISNQFTWLHRWSSPFQESVASRSLLETQ